MYAYCEPVDAGGTAIIREPGTCHGDYGPAGRRGLARQGTPRATIEGLISTRGLTHVQCQDDDCRFRPGTRRRRSPGERKRQEDHIELIASENYTSPRVLEAQGSVLTNKYAEGYPGKRYYGGCEFVDVAESLAIERAKQLFGADLCQRAAAFGLAGECGRVFRAAQPRATRSSA